MRLKRQIKYHCKIHMQTGIFILSFHNDINSVETGAFNTIY